MFALLMKLYGTILLSIFLQPHRTVVAIFVQSNFGLFWWNPGNHARNPVAAETRLKNTAVACLCGLVSDSVLGFNRPLFTKSED